MAEQPTILIVDDEPNFREIFTAKLGAAGFHIETAENGEEGVKKAKQVKPNLILMDVNMPVMDGATAVLKLKEDPELKDIKVAFLTSLGDPRLDMPDIGKKFAKEFGAQDYIKKTDDLDLITQKIKGFLK